MDSKTQLTQKCLEYSEAEHVHESFSEPHSKKNSDLQVYISMGLGQCNL